MWSGSVIEVARLTAIVHVYRCIAYNQLTEFEGAFSIITTPEYACAARSARAARKQCTVCEADLADEYTLKTCVSCLQKQASRNRKAYVPRVLKTLIMNPSAGLSPLKNKYPLSDLQKKVLAFIAKNPGLSMVQAGRAGDTAITSVSANARIRTLQRRNLVERRVSGKHGGKWAVFVVSEPIG